MTSLSTVLATTASLVLLWVLAAWLYADYRTDLLRERLFTLRDELFEYAAAGGIPFDHPIYTLVRTTLNGFIRFAERVRPSLLLLAGWQGRGDPASRPELAFAEQFARATEALDPESRRMVEGTVQRMHAVVFEQLLLRSPLLLLALVPVVGMRAARRLGERLPRGAALRWLRVLDSAALEAGGTGFARAA